MSLVQIIVWLPVLLLASVLVSWLFRMILQRIPAFRSISLSGSFGVLIIAIYFLVALLAPIVAPFGERDIVGDPSMPWSEQYLLGTDNLGRDMLTRMIYGARNTIGIALITTCLAAVVGGFFGMLSATVGDRLDVLLARLVDILMAIPALIFALLLLTIFGTSILTLIVAIAIIDATRIFRLSRAVAMTIVTLDFVEAARLRGEGNLRLIFREIFPNAMAPLLAEFGLRFCFVFLMISSLSFLGVGIQPPTADWGSMVRDNAGLISFGDATPLLPAGAIALLAVAVNFVVDWQLHRASGLNE